MRTEGVVINHSTETADFSKGKHWDKTYLGTFINRSTYVNGPEQAV